MHTHSLASKVGGPVERMICREAMKCFVLMCRVETNTSNDTVYCTLRFCVMFSLKLLLSIVLARVLQNRCPTGFYMEIRLN